MYIQNKVLVVICIDGWPSSAEEKAALGEWINSVPATTLKHLYVALQGRMLRQAIDSLNM